MKTIDFAVVTDKNGFKFLNCSSGSEDFNVALIAAVKTAFGDTPKEESNIKTALLRNANKTDIAIAFIDAEIELGKDSKGYNIFTKCLLSQYGKEELLNLRD